MITCPQCRNSNLEGSLVCSTCHYFFVADQPTPRVVRTSGLLSRNPYRIQTIQQENCLVLNPNKLFKIRDELINGRLILGRADNNGQTTFLRLNIPNAVDLGVSRSHAAILPSTEGLMIQDLGSTNGTYLNDIKLVIHHNYWLAHADLLRLGELVLRIYLEN